jgi:transcriptional regulator with XRE-family HTH domain
MKNSSPPVLFGDDAAQTTSDDGLLAADHVWVMISAVGWLLRRARENRGLLLADIARHCGLSTSVLCRVELARREPRLRLVLQMCELLEVRFSDVMRMAEDEAYPYGHRPWTTQPEELIGQHSKSEDSTVRKVVELAQKTRKELAGPTA